MKKTIRKKITVLLIMSMLMQLLVGVAPVIAEDSGDLIAEPEFVPLLAAVLFPGEITGATSATITDHVYGSLVVNVTEQEIATPQVGEVAPTAGDNLLEDYESGADITAGVAAGNYLQIYDVDMTDEVRIMAFYQVELTEEDIKEEPAEETIEEDIEEEIIGEVVEEKATGAMGMFGIALMSSGTILETYTLGENVTGTLYDDGELVIEGTGSMYDFSDANRPGFYNTRASITEVMIGDEVTSVGNFLFQDCSSLTNVEIGSDVESIGTYALFGCTTLKTVTIPDSVKSIGDYAFYSCTALEAFTIPNSVTSMGSAFWGCSSLTHVTIPDSLSSIDSNVFRLCTALTSVEFMIPSSVTSIGMGAFFGCSALASIVIPDSVTSISADAFHGCTSLASITNHYKGTNQTIIGNPFTNMCPSPKTAYAYPANVSFINAATAAGYDIKNLYDVSFDSKGGTFIDPITGVSHGETIAAPATAPTKTDYTFAGWYKEESLTTQWIFDTDTVIDDITLYAKWAETYKLGDNVTGTLDSDGTLVITGDGAMYDYDRFDSPLYSAGNDIKEVEIIGEIKSIGSYAIADCSELTSVIIPNSVERIGDHAFYNCSALTSIAIPDSVTSIGVEAFADCIELTSIIIPNSVTSMGVGAFSSCTNLASVAISNSVTSISEGAFSNCYALTSVVIPDSVMSIGNDAFKRCYALTSVVIPNSVTSIGEGVFDSCTELTSVVLGNSVTSIGVEAFASCTKLTSITIPNSVTSISADAFYDCIALGTITNLYKGIDQIIGVEAFITAAPDPKTAYAYFANQNFIEAATAAGYTIAYLDTYTVSFNSKDGTSVEDMTGIRHGATITAPATTRIGYTFAGWYKDAALTTQWIFDTDTVTGNTILYAKWTRIGGGGSTSSSQGSTTPTQESVIVIINGQEYNAGTERKTTEDGKSTFIIEVNNQAIESKINEAIRNNPSGTGNTIRVPVSHSNSEVAKVELTGDIVKKLEENTFDVFVKRDNVEYIIPAEEFTISKVAENLGVSEKDLKDIKVEVKISKIDETVVAKYNEAVKASGAELVFPPVEFEIAAKTTKSDGTTGKVEISKFSIYVERVMEIPAGVDPSKITTGVVFNPDGTYSHVPTAIYQKDGKWFAKINSLTNSTYSVIWNPISIKSVENHWAKETVNDMASRLVIFDPESFQPNKAITRADFAEYIVRALGLYREGHKHENYFLDVSSTGERTLAILIANEYGIVSGYPDDTFRPAQQITREEAMVMLQRAMQLTKLTGSDKDRYRNYTDFDKVSNWAEVSVKEALSAHVFNGTSGISISPKSNLTYAETAQAIKNLLKESKLIN
jgi:uncharacterized repeat protein (TIGR02543 family)